MLLKYWKIVEILNPAVSQIQLMSEWHYSHTAHEECCGCDILYKHNLQKVLEWDLCHSLTPLPSAELGFFWRSPLAVREEQEIASEHPIIFVKSFFPLFFSDIWWLELDKMQNVLVPCLFHQRTLMFTSLILLLKEQPKPHCFSRCSSFQENIVVGREVQETSGPSK